MKALLVIATCILTLPLLSFEFTARGSNEVDDEKYLNFVAAVENTSTFSYFTVITVKNVNTGVTKEICTKGKFIVGALHRELNLPYDTKGQREVLDFAKSKQDRNFEFKSEAALKNVSFFDYDPNLVDKIQSQYHFSQALEKIEKEGNFSIKLSHNEMKAVAHILFNKGYLTGENNCYGGTLEYAGRKMSVK